MSPVVDVLKKKREPKEGKVNKSQHKPISALTEKAELVRAMGWEYPTVALDVGTVSANLEEALGESDLIPRIKKWLQDMFRLASDTKR